MSAPKRIFHFALPRVWQAARPSDTVDWRPASLESEGFVHLSFPEQLAGTLDVHFAGVDEVLLFELDEEALAEKLVMEASRGGALFPHVYGPIPHRAFLRWWRIARAGGALAPPRLGERAAADRPVGNAYSDVAP